MYITDIVNKMTEEQLNEIVLNYKTLQQDGVLGDCYLRQQANEYNKNNGLGRLSISMLMGDFYTSVLERFYVDYICSK